MQICHSFTKAAAAGAAAAQAQLRPVPIPIPVADPFFFGYCFWAQLSGDGLP